MAQPPPERASSGNNPRGSAAGPRGRKDHPHTDGHLAALLGAAEADLLAAISILALSGMRFAELRRLRVAQCGRGSFRVGECAANLGPREVPIHTLAFGKAVRAVVQDTDRYGRAVGRVHDSAVDVNAEMVRRGAAWVFRRYSRDPSLLRLEGEARAARRGLWALPEAERTPPWEWRAANR